MRNTNPVENTGVILRLSDGAFLGSCFLFRYPETALTAAHCVAAYESHQLGVAYPGSRAGSRTFPVGQIQAHGRADVAVLTIDPPPERDITWAQYALFNDRAYGLDVMSYGYPQEWVAGEPRPMPRLFKGHVQRFFEHSSHLGYSYMAAELSFGCPAGLSGASVINPQLIGRVYGLITENVRVESEVESILEVDDKGGQYKETFARVINYGVAVWLPAIEDWINSTVPPVSEHEMSRRATNQHKWSEEDRSRKG